MTELSTLIEVEALIFASEKAITALEIKNILSELHPDELFSEDQVAGFVQEIIEKYNDTQYPFTVKEIGGGYQFLTKSQLHPTIAKLNGDKFMKRLSTAALETLSIIAYKQPITKPDIEYIRGVNCDYSIQKLLEKELIFISGRNEEAVGKPLLYSTSKSFMDYLGINSMDDLPKLREVVGEDIVIPTNAEDAVPEASGALIVASDGTLLEVEELPTSEVNSSESIENTDIEASSESSSSENDTDETNNESSEDDKA
jgi:segregation and condensation protein B